MTDSYGITQRAYLHSATMRRRTVSAVSGLFFLLLTAGGCSAAPYSERMKYLDDMAQKGIEYRGKLHQQGTEPSQDACKTGFELLQADPPADMILGDTSQGWRDQVQEAYVKSCMTGASRPKPDPSGVKAVTPVPFNSPTVIPSS